MASVAPFSFAVLKGSLGNVPFKEGGRFLSETERWPTQLHVFMRACDPEGKLGPPGSLPQLCLSLYVSLGSLLYLEIIQLQLTPTTQVATA